MCSEDRFKILSAQHVESPIWGICKVNLQINKAAPHFRKDCRKVSCMAVWMNAPYAFSEFGDLIIGVGDCICIHVCNQNKQACACKPAIKSCNGRLPYEQDQCHSWKELSLTLSLNSSC